MNVLRKLDQWHRTISGLLVFGVVELALAYGLGSWAIDSGRLLAWFLSLVFLVGGLQNFARLIGRAIGHARA